MKTNGDDCAFPQTWHPDMRCDPTLTPPGITKREYFVAMALQGLLSTRIHRRCPGAWIADKTLKRVKKKIGE